MLRGSSEQNPLKLMQTFFLTVTHSSKPGQTAGTGEICFVIINLKVNRQRPTSVMRGPELKIPTLTKWLISPLVHAIVKLCKMHIVLKTNSNINIYNET